MDWNVYSFDQTDATDVRLRRLERGRQTLRGGSYVSPSGTFSAIPSGLLDTNQIDLASSGLVTRGNVAPTGFKGKFSYTSTTTSATIYWDNSNGSQSFQRLGADGSATNVTSGLLTIGGLTAGTYGVLPYYTPFNNCGIGWIVGDSGSPKFAFTTAAQTAVAVQQQNLIGREPMTTGFMTVVIPGVGTGGGSPGGGGKCVMLGTDIEPLGDLTYSTVHHPQTQWIAIRAQGQARTLNCTPDHLLFHAEEGKMKAEEFKLGDWIITDLGEREVIGVKPFVRVCTKVEVVMPEGHLFWANGFLSHNLKILNPE